MRDSPRSNYSRKVLTLLDSADGVTLDALAEAVSDIAQQLDTAAVTPQNVPVVQAVNQALNTTFSHSVQSWNNTGAANDTRYECYAWFSNDETAGTAMDAGVFPTVPNFTLKEETHATYDADYSDWDWATGTARFQGFKSVDTLLPGNNVEPGYSLYANITVVRANQYVYINPDTRLFAGLYGNSTANGWEFISGEFIPTAEVVGTVTTPTSRDYVVHTRTSRGFTVQSEVLTVASAPSNTDFSNGAVVVLQWKQVLNYGVLGYDIYRKTGATYVKLVSVVTGQLTYIDNNSVVESVGGYPSYDFQSLVAYTATNTGALTTVPYSGDPLNTLWSSIPFAIRVPQNYDKGDSILADGQWLRFGLFGQNANGQLDLRITDAVILITTTALESVSAQFRSDMVGMTVSITYKGNTFSDTIASYSSATRVGLTNPSPFDVVANGVAIIEGGGLDHSLLGDLVTLSYQEGAAYAPNPLDNDGTHGIPPVTPNGTTQGGGGQGGSGEDGEPVCLFAEELVRIEDEKITAKELHDRFHNGEWMRVFDGDVYKNVVDAQLGIDDIWYLETENKVNLKPTDTKQIFTPNGKKTVASLNVGDEINTNINGIKAPSQITTKHKILIRRIVVRFSLEPSEKFLAGSGAGEIEVSNLKPGDIIVTV